MGKMKILLDSVILIDHLNKITPATEFIAKHQSEQLYISVITRAEVLAGIDKRYKIHVIKLLDKFSLLPIDKQAADKAAELRITYRWKLPDAFQAALAINHKLKLVTRNTKDFPAEKHNFVIVPYKISSRFSAD